jgi:hypothetical protein
MLIGFFPSLLPMKVQCKTTRMLHNNMEKIISAITNEGSLRLRQLEKTGKAQLALENASRALMKELYFSSPSICATRAFPGNVLLRRLEKGRLVRPALRLDLPSASYSIPLIL